jgi:hypothetical protein
MPSIRRLHRQRRNASSRHALAVVDVFVSGDHGLGHQMENAAPLASRDRRVACPILNSTQPFQSFPAPAYLHRYLAAVTPMPISAWPGPVVGRDPGFIRGALSPGEELIDD